MLSVVGDLSFCTSIKHFASFFVSLLIVDNSFSQLERGVWFPLLLLSFLNLMML